MHDTRSRMNRLLDHLRTNLVANAGRARTMPRPHVARWRRQLLALQDHEQRRTAWRAALPLLVFAAAYVTAWSYLFIAAFLGAQPPPSPLFPPGAVLFAALLLTPPRRWWYFLVAAFLIQVPILAYLHLPLWWNVLGFTPDAIEPIVAASLIRRVIPLPVRFASLREVTVYTACVATAVLIGATIGSVVNAAGGEPYWTSWETWFLGDFLSYLVLAPTLLLWIAAGVRGLRAGSRWRYAEAALLYGGLLVMGLTVFDTRLLGPDTARALIYLPVPLLLWAAVRFGPKGIASALSLIVVLAVPAVANASGPFASQSAPTAATLGNVFTLQLFLLVIGVPLFFLAALVQEHTRTEEALRTSEARSRAVVRNLPHSAVLLFDADLRHSFADGPELQAVGLTPVSLEGRTVWEAFPMDLAAALAPHYKAALAGQAMETDVVHAQYIYRIQVVPMTAGPARAGMVVLQDVTEQRRARDELERGRTLTTLLGALSQEFRTLAEHSPDFIARLDLSGRYVYVNQPGADLLGLPAEHWIGKTFVELGIRRTGYQPWMQALREVVETRTPRTFDAEVKAPDGRVRSLHVRYVPEFAEDGELRSVLGIATDVSALKEAETRLAAQASELEAIFEAQADGVAVYSQYGHLVRANRAWQAIFRRYAEILGLSADPQFNALPLADQVAQVSRHPTLDGDGKIIPTDQLPAARALSGETVNGSRAVDELVHSPDGRVLRTSVSAAPVHDPAGHIHEAVVVVRDVTTRYALEQQVAEQAAQLEAIFEAMTDGVFVLDAQGHVTRINAASHALFGRMPADGRTDTARARARLIDLRDADGQPLPLEQLPTQRVLRGEVLAGDDAVTLRVRTHDERERSISLTGGPLRDAAGQIIGGVGVVRDVTELQRVQAALAEQERLFRTLVEHSPDIIARFDRELRYLYVSPAIRQISPVPEADYFGKTNAELGWPEDAYGPAHRAIEQVFQTGQPQTLEESDAAFSDSATARYFRAQILPERAADGRVESVLTVTTDITALKRTEQALRAANASLEIARQEEERRKQIAESLRGVLTALNSKRPSQEVLRYIVRQAEELLGSAAAVIYGPDHLTDSMSPDARASARATTLRVQAAEGLRIGGRRPRPQQRLPFLDSAVEQVLVSAQPVARVDLSGDASFDYDATVEAGADTGVPCLDGVLPAPYRALLVIPIRVHDGLYGCLLLFYPQPHHFVAEEVALAQAYADQAAQAIMNARVQAQLEQEAAAAERNHLARELHDTVKQDLFSASLLAESLPTVWRTHRAEAEVGLRQLHTLTQGALAGLHALLLELRPAALEQSPLSEALRKLGAAMSTRAGVPILVEVEGAAGPEPPLPATVKFAFYRVAQESLMNAAKYAKARTIRVQLRANGSRGKRRLELEIADDGRGFDPVAIPAGHFGLTIMQERAQAVGASMRVRSRAGQGTVVVMSWRSGRKVVAPERAVGAAIAVGGIS